MTSDLDHPCVGCNSQEFKELQVTVQEEESVPEKICISCPSFEEYKNGDLSDSELMICVACLRKREINSPQDVPIKKVMDSVRELFNMVRKENVTKKKPHSQVFLIEAKVYGQFVECDQCGIKLQYKDPLWLVSTLVKEGEGPPTHKILNMYCEYCKHLGDDLSPERETELISKGHGRHDA